jgi:hypothetical protein
MATQLALIAGNILLPKKDIEHPTFTKILLKLAAEEDNLKNESLKSAISVALALLPVYKFCLDEIKGCRPTQVTMALPTAIGEMFAYRLSRCAGFNHVAPVELRLTEPREFDDFVKERNAVWVVGKRIPKSLPIYFLSNKIATTPAFNTHRIDKLILNFTSDIDEWVRNTFLDALDKRCPVNRAQYSDFTPEMESSPRVLENALWNSPQRLFTYAFSYFLHSSHPHNSNTLIDADGLLWQLDFEKVLYSEGVGDIAELFGAIKNSNSVMRACREISAIGEQDIESALGGIDLIYWQSEGSIIRNQNTAIKYFNRRLRAWKHYFKPIEKQTIGQGVGFIPYQNADRQYAPSQT